jgi:pSer/pThr/pTyr-binding forkhead associated (FHA) protein
LNTSGLLNRKTIIFVIGTQTVTLPQAREILVGRFAPTDSLQPDVDLSPFKAEEKGVSRRHIKITFKDGQYWVIDLASMNGTWLNGEPIKSVAEYPLRDGDRLRLSRPHTNIADTDGHASTGILCW